MFVAVIAKIRVKLKLEFRNGQIKLFFKTLLFNIEYLFKNLSSYKKSKLDDAIDTVYAYRFMKIISMK